MNVIFRNIDGFEVIEPDVINAEVSEDIVFTTRAMDNLIYELNEAHPISEDAMETKPFFIRLFLANDNLNAKSFAIQFDDSIDKFDHIFELRKTKVIIARKDLFYFMGMLIDYVKSETVDGYIFISINEQNLENLNINFNN